MNTWAKVGVVALALLLGFGAGWWVADSVVARKTVVVQDKTIVDKNAQLEQRVKDEQVAKASAEAKAADAQQQSAALNQQLDDARSKNASLQEQIDHGDFDAPQSLPVAGKCPGNPLAGDEFGRLYDAAAAGQLAPGP